MALALAAPMRPAAAEDGLHPVDSALEFMNLKANPGAMPDFVEQSRPGTESKDYMPVGVKPADHALKKKTPAEIKAMTAELDAARAAQLAGKRPKAPGTPAAKAVPAKATPPKTATGH